MTFEPFGLQTGNNDASMRSSYATSMVYNDKDREITIVGGTYSNYFNPGVERTDDRSDSDCFVAIQHLRDPSRLTWLRRRQYGSTSVSEFCTDIQVRQGERYIVIGHAGENSMLSQLLPRGDSHRTVYGMVLDLDESIGLRGGNLLHSNEIQFPVAVAANDAGDEIFVVEIVSDVKPEASQMMSRLFSSIEPGGPDASATAYSVPLAGFDFSVRLQKLKSLDNDFGTVRAIGVGQKFQPGWSRQYGTLDMVNVQVSTLDYISPSILLLTGFTRGKGMAFGEPSELSVGSLDSFLMTVDASNGSMLNSTRVESVLPGDDRILGTCIGGGGHEVYVVGMTTGLFDSKYVYHQPDRSTEHHVYAFIQKFDLGTMEPLWSRQVGAVIDVVLDPDGRKSTQVHGLACVVTPDGDEVFMAGNVKDGASLVMPNGQNYTSAGGTDIFVTKFRAVDGNLIFAAQIGSAGDDSLASKKSLSTDRDGNLIVLGNTNGSLFRDKTTQVSTDIFTMSVGREHGDFLSPFDSRPLDPEDEGISFFGHRYADPVKQARYENTMAALMAIMCLVLATLCITIYVCWKRAGHMKGDAVEKESFKTHRSSSDGSTSEFNICSFRDDVSSASTLNFVRPSLETKPSLLIVPDKSKRTRGLNANRYFGTDSTEYSEDGGSIRSMLERRRKTPCASSAGGVPPSLSRETQRNQVIDPFNHGCKQKDDVSSAYGEIYELLSIASERLGLDNFDADSDLDPPQPPPKRNWRRKKEEEEEEDMTLEEIWDMQLV